MVPRIGESRRWIFSDLVIYQAHLLPARTDTDEKDSQACPLRAAPTFRAERRVVGGPRKE